MPDESKQAAPASAFRGGCVNPSTEELVLQQVLGHQRGYPLQQLRADLDDLPPEWIEESIESLAQVGLVIVKRTRLHMSAALKRLDDLDMVTI